jgi:hypothetical protein
VAVMGGATRIMIAGIEDAFPALRSEGFEETSPPSEKYNCIAWAAGRASQWWWPYQHPAYFWPEGQTREVTSPGDTKAGQGCVAESFVRCAVRAAS